MDKREKVTKLLQEKLEYAQTVQKAFIAVCSAVKKYDGKVLNRRVNGAINKALLPTQMHGGYYKESSYSHFSAFTGRRRINFYIDGEGRFDFQDWYDKNQRSLSEESIAMYQRGLDNIDAVVSTWEMLEKTVAEAENTLKAYGIGMRSDTVMY